MVFPSSPETRTAPGDALEGLVDEALDKAGEGRGGPGDRGWEDPRDRNW